MDCIVVKRAGRTDGWTEGAGHDNTLCPEWAEGKNYIKHRAVVYHDNLVSPHGTFSMCMLKYYSDWNYVVRLWTTTIHPILDAVRRYGELRTTVHAVYTYMSCWNLLCYAFIMTFDGGLQLIKVSRVIYFYCYSISRWHWWFKCSHVEGKDAFIIYDQDGGGWWLGDAMSHSISDHDID